MQSVREQYEKFPYPPIGGLALPRRGQGEAVRYEFGMDLARNAGASHAGKRILVAGAGTLEAALIARAHPEAREIVAVDLSAVSIGRLKGRMRLARLGARIARLGRSSAFDRIQCVAADLHEWEDGDFDYIVATNMLQHVADPAALLGRLAGWLPEGGLMRVVTYPRASRIWMRAIGRWLELSGLSAQSEDLVARCGRAIAELPPDHPSRATFEHYPERTSRSELVDAFFHACENPLNPLEWKDAAWAAGLRLAGESQSETSRSGFADDLAGKILDLDAFEKLQALDDLLELCANPVLWFRRDERIGQAISAGGFSARDENIRPISPKSVTADPMRITWESDPAVIAEQVRSGLRGPYSMPSSIRWELGRGAGRAEEILARAGVSLESFIEELGEQVGPHVSPPPRQADLPGLSITEYPVAEMMELPEPWTREKWDSLEALLGGSVRLRCERFALPPGEGDRGLGAQAARLDLALGASASWLEGVMIETGR